MALRGNLKDFSLPDVFQLVTFSRKTGVLRIKRESGDEGSVWFRDGDVFFAQSNWHTELLGERLVRAQRLTPQALARALDMRASEPEGGRRLGQILVDEGYLTDKVLEAFVSEQIQETIFDLMRWDEGEFDFEAMPEAVEEDIGLSVSIENVIMEGSRRLEEWARIRKKIPSMDVVFKMATAPGEGTFEISLKPTEWNLLLLVDGTRSVADLAHATNRTDFEVARIVYGLFSAGLLEFASDEEIERLRAERVRREAKLEQIEAVRREKAQAAAAAAQAREAAQAAKAREAAAEVVAEAAPIEAGVPVSAEPVEEPEFLAGGVTAPTAADAAALEEMMGAVLRPPAGVAPTPPTSVEAPVPHTPAEEPAFMGVEHAEELDLPMVPVPSVEDLLTDFPELRQSPESVQAAAAAVAEVAEAGTAEQDAALPDAGVAAPAAPVDAESPAPPTAPPTAPGTPAAAPVALEPPLAPPVEPEAPVALEPPSASEAPAAPPIAPEAVEPGVEPAPEAPATAHVAVAPTQWPAEETAPATPEPVADEQAVLAALQAEPAQPAPFEFSLEPELAEQPAAEPEVALEPDAAAIIPEMQAEAPMPETAPAQEAWPGPGQDFERDLMALGLGELPADLGGPSELLEAQIAEQPVAPAAPVSAVAGPELGWIAEMDEGQVAAAAPEPPLDAEAELAGIAELADLAAPEMDAPLPAEQPAGAVDVESPDFSQLLESLDIDSAAEVAPALTPEVAGEEFEPLEFDEDLLGEIDSEGGGVISTDAFLEDITIDEIGFTGEMTDELSALTGATRPAGRPQANVNRIPDAGSAEMLRRDTRVDRDTLLKIIDGIKNL